MKSIRMANIVAAYENLNDAFIKTNPMGSGFEALINTELIKELLNEGIKHHDYSAFKEEYKDRIKNSYKEQVEDMIEHNIVLYHSVRMTLDILKKEIDRVRASY